MSSAVLHNKDETLVPEGEQSEKRSAYCKVTLPKIQNCLGMEWASLQR